MLFFAIFFTYPGGIQCKSGPTCSFSCWTWYIYILSPQVSGSLTLTLNRMKTDETSLCVYGFMMIHEHGFIDLYIIIHIYIYIYHFPSYQPPFGSGISQPSLMTSKPLTPHWSSGSVTATTTSMVDSEINCAEPKRRTSGDEDRPWAMNIMWLKLCHKPSRKSLINGWYVYHSQAWVVHDIVLPT